MKFLKSKALSFILVAILIFTTACNKNNSSENKNSKNSNEKEKVSQEIIIGENSDYGGYDPLKGGVKPFTIRAMIFDTLVKLDYDYNKAPGLATEWSRSEDSKTWTFKLRKNVTFHDGENWNSKAAKLNLEHRIAVEKKGLYANIESIETPDDYTLVIKLKKPNYLFDSDLTLPNRGFISPKAFDENHKVIASIGTGPFKFVEWKKDVEVILEANEKYYDGSPKIKKVTIKNIPDSNARALALESGEIDFMSGRSALTSLETLKKKDNIKLDKRIGQTSVFVFMNTRDAVLSDINVRKAVSFGTNFKSAVPALLSDLASPPENYFSPVFKKYTFSDVKLPEYNKEKAIQSLKDSNYSDTNNDGYVDKDGKNLSLTITVTDNNEEDKALAEIMQNQLKDIGIELKIKPLDNAALYESTKNDQYQLTIQGQNYVQHDDPSINYKEGYWHSQSYNHPYYDKDLDAMIDKLYYSGNSDERIKLHNEIQKYVMDKYAVIMVFHRNNVVLMNKKVKDFKIAAGTWQFYKGLETAYIGN